ncbi:transposase [Actinosynnema sp. NPDC023658]|uniref:transposase n=1 Tax=Actinosynnema sp. NPDC023658 TaxID=3155465 RepID=UPI0033EB6B7D
MVEALPSRTPRSRDPAWEPRGPRRTGGPVEPQSGRTPGPPAPADLTDPSRPAAALRPVVADSAYGDNPAFRQRLTDRGLTYALAVSASTSLHPATSVPVAPSWSGTGHPPMKTATRTSPSPPRPR